jgi:DNA-binding NarL/FixJ family response regulator
MPISLPKLLAGRSTAADPSTTLALIVDDHPVVRFGVESVLRAFGFAEVLQAANAAQASALIASRASALDLVVLDLDLGDRWGGSLVGELRSHGYSGAIIVLTVDENDEHAMECLRLGVQAFIPKNGDPRLLAAAVQAVMHGGATVPQHLLGRVATQVAAQMHIGNVQGGVRRTQEGAERNGVGAERNGVSSLQMTKRQREVAKLLALGHTNKEIARELGMAPGTVKNYVSELLSSLGVPNRTRAARAFADLLGGHGIAGAPDA